MKNCIPIASLALLGLIVVTPARAQHRAPAAAPRQDGTHSHAHFSAPDTLRQLSQLERQVTELESIFSRPAAGRTATLYDSQLSRLEKQVTELEALLRRRTLVAPPAPARDPLAALERKIQELETELRSVRRGDPSAASLNATPPKRPVRRRVVLPQRSKKSTQRKVVIPTSPLNQPPAAPDKPPASLVRAESPLANAHSPSPKARKVSSSPAAGKAFCATLRLKSKPHLSETLASTGPNVFGIFEYEVVKVTRGGPVGSRQVRVAHGIRWGGGKTSVMNRKIGAEIAMDVVPLWWYPALKEVDRIGGNKGDGVIYTPRLPR